jgi:hypothetical protein
MSGLRVPARRKSAKPSILIPKDKRLWASPLPLEHSRQVESILKNIA